MNSYRPQPRRRNRGANLRDEKTDIIEVDIPIAVHISSHRRFATMLYPVAQRIDKGLDKAGHIAAVDHAVQIHVAGEQVVGSFNYARGTFSYSEYLLIRERPDHSGRHVLSMSAKLGFLGNDAPIYEHFFAGGYSTMRGFDFRGASPVVDGVEVGGEFQWLNSVQYLFPVTADDMLYGVLFTDFGTVEQKAKVNDFRVVVGTGLRITVPAMGPAPIALDFGWAINRADFDDTEVFSFSLGFTR